MLFLPINLFDGILFQLMVFILDFGTGVSCCGNLPRSTISGVLGRWVSVASAEKEYPKVIDESDKYEENKLFRRTW